jgi:pimeloyl-ACP methyl ester carboxylesterase
MSITLLAKNTAEVGHDIARIRVGRAAIAFKEAGRGQPVVLLHGSAASASQWRGLTRALESRFHVFAPELHGHGDSRPWTGPGPLTLAAEAAIIAAFADRVDRTIHLVAHSFGAAVALHFARTFPDRLRSLVLIEPVAFHLLRDGRAARPSALAEIEALAAEIQWTMGEPSVGMRRFVDYWNGDGAWFRLPPDRRAAVASRIHAVAAHFGATLGESAPLSAYGAIRVPVLLVCGSESPAPIWPITVALSEVMPQSRILLVPGAGHMVPITHADVVNPAIAEHLACEADRCSIATLQTRRERQREPVGA